MPRHMDHLRGPWRVVSKTLVIVFGVSALSLLAIAVVLFTPVSPSARASLFRGSFVDQGPAPALAPGGSASYTVRFRNTGLAPWQRGVPGMQVNLAVAGASTDFADMRVGWLSADRIATTVEDLVLPGSIATFTFSLRAPSVPGVYRLPLRLVVDDLTWLEDERVAVVIASDLGFHSKFVDQSDHVTLRPGDTSLLTLHFRNVGARTWTRGVAGQQVNLGVDGDDRSASVLGMGWPSADRVAVQTEPTVQPGGIGTFVFRVRAPAGTGTYALRIRPVVDGLTWLEDDGVVSVINVVTALDAPAAASTMQIGTTTASKGPKITSSASASPTTVPLSTWVKIG